MDTTITSIWAHDPIANNEAQITNYDTTILTRAEQQGIIFIAEHADGSRTRISAKDITKPVTPPSGSYVFVTPAYVDTRMQAAASVFDAISTIINTTPTGLSADQQDEQDNTITPIQAFNDALAAFKRLVIKDTGEDGVDGNA